MTRVAGAIWGGRSGPEQALTLWGSAESSPNSSFSDCGRADSQSGDEEGGTPGLPPSVPQVPDKRDEDCDLECVVDLEGRPSSSMGHPGGVAASFPTGPGCRPAGEGYLPIQGDGLDAVQGHNGAEERLQNQEGDGGPLGWWSTPW